MLYYSTLKKEHDRSSELWVRRAGELWPVFDYKISVDQIRLISDPDCSIPEATTLQEILEYVQSEGNPRQVPYTIVDELTDQYLDIKDRFENKLIFEICS